MAIKPSIWQIINPYQLQDWQDANPSAVSYPLNVADWVKGWSSAVDPLSLDIAGLPTGTLATTTELAINNGTVNEKTTLSDLATFLEGEIPCSTLLPVPQVNLTYNREVQHKANIDEVSNFTWFTNFPVSGKIWSSWLHVTFSWSIDPNTATSFSPNFPAERSAIYHEEWNPSNVWMWSNWTYYTFPWALSHYQIANGQHLFAGINYKQWSDDKFFLKNTPMIFMEIYDSRQPRKTNYGSKRKRKHHPTYDTVTWKWKNLNRIWNTNFWQVDFWVPYLHTEFDFTKNSYNSDEIIKINVPSLFWDTPALPTDPSFLFPVNKVDRMTDPSRYSPRFGNKNGNKTRTEKTSNKQAIRFRFACIDPNDNRNVILSEPSEVYTIQAKWWYFLANNEFYYYQRTIKRGR